MQSSQSSSSRHKNKGRPQRGRPFRTTLLTTLQIATHWILLQQAGLFTTHCDELSLNCLRVSMCWVFFRGSIPLISTKQTLHEHLLFQRRLCRQGAAVMSEQKPEGQDAMRLGPPAFVCGIVHSFKQGALPKPASTGKW